MSFFEKPRIPKYLARIFRESPSCGTLPQEKGGPGGGVSYQKGLSSHDNRQAHGKLKTPIIDFLNLHGQRKLSSASSYSSSSTTSSALVQVTSLAANFRSFKSNSS